MKKVYFLSTCNTCQKIMTGLGAKLDDFVKQDIKHEKMTFDQIDEMKSLAGSYVSIFSKRSMKYRAWGLNEKELTEEEMRGLIEKEYTFLKRPVFIVDDQIFVGNSKKVVEELSAAL